MGKPQVLLVEDNPINALVVSRMIDALCEVVHVESDREAFEQVNQQDFALILMDISLGHGSKDGTTIMQELRQQARFARMPMLAVTSFAMLGDREKFIAAGFDEYIPKPVDREDLLDKVKRFLSTA